MDKMTHIDCTTQGVQEGRGMIRRRKATKPEIRVVVIRPELPNREALDSVYQILATTKSA